MLNMKKTSVLLATIMFIVAGVSVNCVSAATKDVVLSERLSGNILLQVEENGEAWYVSPFDQKRYYMKNGEVAYEMMRNFGLGITNDDIGKIPIADTLDKARNHDSLCPTIEIANRLKGKILLGVEMKGEAYYVHPETCFRVYMKDGQAAFDIMRYLGLGITNTDLDAISVGLLSEWYFNTEQEFDVKMPDNWEFDREVDYGTTMYEYWKPVGDTQDYPYISFISHYEAGMEMHSMQEIEASIVEEIMGEDDFTITQAEMFEVDGYPALKIQFEKLNESYKSYQAYWVAVKISSTERYVLQYAVFGDYEEYLPVFENAVNTFRYNPRGIIYVRAD